MHMYVYVYTVCMYKYCVCLCVNVECNGKVLFLFNSELHFQIVYIDFMQSGNKVIPFLFYFL